MDLPLVSVVIPTFNRFDYLINAINSVKNQTYKNIEILIINDNSTDKRYYEHDFGSDVKIINLEINQKKLLGYTSVGHVRNFGLQIAKGKYIATLDDDDIWFPEKIIKQVTKLESSPNKLCSTEGFSGRGEYNSYTKYPLYNGERYFKKIARKYKKNIFNSIKNFKFPDEFDFDFLKVHNCIITSSVLVERELINFIGGFRPFPTKDDYAPDYDCWLGLLRLTKCDYINEPLFYYDEQHGNGRNWG